MNRLALIVALLSTACGDFNEAALGVAQAPTALVCGWELDRTEQLAELPAGQCWRITTDAERATTPAEMAVSACDVEPAPRTYRGGAFVDTWGTTFTDHSDGLDYREIVDCP
jgi:hypothetical protein